MIVGKPVENVDGYCWSRSLPNDDRLSRRWTFHGQIRSVEWRGGGIVKTRERFQDHPTVEAMEALLEECAALGVTRPSSYGDLFHQRCFTPATRSDHRKLFPAVPGGWNATTCKNPIHHGRLFQYDIRSAYLWALSIGLPHPKTFRTVRRIDGPGLYWVPSPNSPLLPHPWNKPGMHPATEDELRILPIPGWREATRGVRYEPGTFDVEPYLRDIRQWSCWKAVARSYWGRWIATGSVRQETLDRSGQIRTAREMRDIHRLPIWGAIITSRLRTRLWETWNSPGRRVLRVVTDSVVTDTEMETGEEVGDWKLVQEFEDRKWRINLSGVAAA